MVWKTWQQGKKELFHIITTTLLSLLLPLSFLLLARLSISQYLFTFNPSPQPLSPLISLFLHTNPTLIYALISLISIATLINNLTGKTTIRTESTEPVIRPRLYLSWTLLCTLQVCVGLGIEGSIAAGVNGSVFEYDTSFLIRAIFFIGLHETMIYWSTMVVKPVVDDTVFGFSKEKMWIERVAMGASFGALWWWRLRGEVEVLVVMTQVKKEMEMGVGLADFVGYWLYYFTVVIGMVRIVKGVMWVGVILICRKIEENLGNVVGAEDKV